MFIFSHFYPFRALFDSEDTCAWYKYPLSVASLSLSLSLSLFRLAGHIQGLAGIPDVPHHLRAADWGGESDVRRRRHSSEPERGRLDTPRTTWELFFLARFRFRFRFRWRGVSVPAMLLAEGSTLGFMEFSAQNATGSREEGRGGLEKWRKRKGSKEDAAAWCTLLLFLLPFVPGNTYCAFSSSDALLRGSTQVKASASQHQAPPRALSRCVGGCKFGCGGDAAGWVQSAPLDEWISWLLFTLHCFIGVGGWLEGLRARGRALLLFRGLSWE